MRTLLLLLALVGCPTLVDAFAVAKPMAYRGSLLGVKADVALYRKEDRAYVMLRGIPIGRSVAGDARFKNDGWSVDLDTGLDRALKRRRVKILGAGAFADYSQMWVLIQLPLGLGRHTLTLDRV